MRLLIVTALWPTHDLPYAGTFVRDRAAGLTDPIIVGPKRYDQPTALRYLAIAWRAATARGHVDGVEAHVLFPAGLIGLIAAWLRRVPLVVYAHGADVRETAQENPLYRQLARFVAHSAAAVVTNSEDTARQVRRLGVEPRVVPPGVDLHRFRPSERPAERRVLYLGGLQPRKGYEVARGIAHTVRGPGIDPVAPDLVPATIAEHDIVLMPSIAEPFGVLAVEAIASGRWVVASAVGGLRDIVIDGVNGTLVTDGDFRSALQRVPDFDPFVVAATAERYSAERHQHAMASIWRTARSVTENGRRPTPP